MAASVEKRSYEGALAFLDLSAEIRNKIYGLLFEHEDSVYAMFDQQFPQTLEIHRRVGDENHRLIDPRGFSL